MKTCIPAALIIFSLACFAFLPAAEALNPPPDGGYPGFNTAEGQNALLSLTTGQGNTAVGWYSLFSNTEGSFNTGLGAGTLVLNTGDQNTATGVAALLLNTTGGNNTANGAVALLNNTEGAFNTATGAGALQSNTTGNNNVASGALALVLNVDGGFNTAVGTQALSSNTTGNGNTATGHHALLSNSGGEANTANGFQALLSNTTGGNNTAIGTSALDANTTGNDNTALGVGAGFGITTANSVICIGTGGANVSNSCFIGQIFGTTSSGGIGVFINSDGKLGTTTSSRRFKEEIQPMDKTSEVLFALTPVTFRYKKEVDPSGASQSGLLAEDVEKVNPNLVVRDKEGKPYTVRYDQVNAMLLNEFLKEHRKLEELTKNFQATVAQLTARLDEQAAQIQKVSAQLAGSKPAPQVVLNNH